jgi:hypothetical protein
MSVDIVIRDYQHIVMTKNTPTKESKQIKKAKLSAYNILFSLCYVDEGKRGKCYNKELRDTPYAAAINFSVFLFNRSIN